MDITLVMPTRYFPFMVFSIATFILNSTQKCNSTPSKRNSLILHRKHKYNEGEVFLFSSQLFSFWIFSGQYSFVYFRLLGFLVLMPAYFRPQVYSFDSVSIYLVLK